MMRDVRTLSIAELQQQFLNIEFPEYQREANIWNRDQKQRLIDSILRQFDISAIYFYERASGLPECIDGQQRLNAIMSFLGENPADKRDNGFPLRIDNEISVGLTTPFDILSGQSYRSIQQMDTPPAKAALQAILEYKLNVVHLSGATEDDEFNLQFLRLNLGTLINAGEKLHAMVGEMRDEIFEPGGVGKHPFLDKVRIPGRRFSRELTGAQVLLQSVHRYEHGTFTRARHLDLQRFVKERAELGDAATTVEAVRETLDELERHAPDLGSELRNRAFTVSVVLLAWELQIAGTKQVFKFASYISAFAGRLRWLLDELRSFKAPNEHYRYLINFQRDLTQAAVEKPAVSNRHETLTDGWVSWTASNGIRGDAEYLLDTGQRPPSA